MGDRVTPLTNHARISALTTRVESLEDRLAEALRLLKALTTPKTRKAKTNSSLGANGAAHQG